MARTMTLGRQLSVAFGTLALVALALGGTGLWEASRIYATARTVTDVDMETTLLAAETSHGVEAMRSTVRLAFIDIARQDLGSVGTRKQKADALRAELKKSAQALRQISDEHRDDAEALLRMADEYWQLASPVFDLLLAGDAAGAAEAVKATTALGDRMQQVASGVHEDVDKKLAVEKEGMAARWRTARIVIVCLIALAALVCVVTFVAVRRITRRMRGATNELRGAAQQVSQAAGQVATAAQHLSQGATEQAASLEESSASMEEMGSMTLRNAEHANQAADLMTGVDQQVQQSNQMLQDMIASMSEIRESSTRVGKIIKTIDEIAFQTNILALNAAVEAARAGEAGMGFAVVADEVRNLAQRAADAARDTTGLIEESTHRADAGTRKVAEVAEAISKVTASITKVGDIARQVSAASRDQAQGVSQVTTAIQQMEKVTQTNAATAEESAAASEELNAQAETTLALVEELDALVGQ